jgi:hypothetical protein
MSRHGRGLLWVSHVVRRSPGGRCRQVTDVESSANAHASRYPAAHEAILQAAKMESILATRRDDAIPQQADVVGDVYLSPIALSVDVRLCIAGSTKARGPSDGRSDPKAPIGRWTLCAGHMQCSKIAVFQATIFDQWSAKLPSNRAKSISASRVCRPRLNAACNLR